MTMHTYNEVILEGSPLGEPERSHENHGQLFFRQLLEVPRLSGTPDVLPLLLRQEQYMETWLTRILINECYAIMRRSRRIIPMAEVGENQPAQWEAQNADEMLCRALTALPDTLRLPIVLHYMEGMDIRTIARTLRIRESAVKSRLHRGREKLRQSDELKELVEDE